MPLVERICKVRDVTHQAAAFWCRRLECVVGAERMTSELQSDDALKLAKPNCAGSTLPRMKNPMPSPPSV